MTRVPVSVFARAHVCVSVCVWIHRYVCVCLHMPACMYHTLGNNNFLNHGGILRGRDCNIANYSALHH